MFFSCIVNRRPPATPPALPPSPPASYPLAGWVRSTARGRYPPFRSAFEGWPRLSLSRSMAKVTYLSLHYVGKNFFSLYSVPFTARTAVSRHWKEAVFLGSRYVKSEAKATRAITRACRQRSRRGGQDAERKLFVRLQTLLLLHWEQQDEGGVAARSCDLACSRRYPHDATRRGTRCA